MKTINCIIIAFILLLYSKNVLCQLPPIIVKTEGDNRILSDKSNKSIKNNALYLMDSSAYQSYKARNDKLFVFLKSAIEDDSLYSYTLIPNLSLYEKEQLDPFGITFNTSFKSKFKENTLLTISNNIRQSNFELIKSFINIIDKNVENFSSSNTNSFMIDKPFSTIETNDASKCMKSIKEILEGCSFNVIHIKPNIYEGSAIINPKETEKIILWIERDFDNPLMKLKLFLKSVFLVRPLFSNEPIDVSRIKTISSYSNTQNSPSSCVKKKLLEFDK